MKIAVYTAIFGGYDKLIPQPKLPNVEYICFTDSDIKSNTWQIKKVDLPIKNDYARSNRFYKINPHLHLPEYDYSIYIDGNMLIINPIKNIIDKVFSNSTMAVFAHTPPINNPANCIYKEYQRIWETGEQTGKWVDEPAQLKKHIDFLLAEEYPKENGLLVGSVLFRKHHNKKVIETMELWWHMVKNYSRRDQLSFNYAAWKTGLEFSYMPGEVRHNNPWFWRLGGHKQSLWFRLLKYRIRKIIGKIKHPKEIDFIHQF